MELLEILGNIFTGVVELLTMAAVGVMVVFAACALLWFCAIYPIISYGLRRLKG